MISALTSAEIQKLAATHRLELEALRNRVFKAMHEVGSAVLAGKRDWGALERHRQAIQREEDAIAALDMLAGEAEHHAILKQSQRLAVALERIKKRVQELDAEVAEKSKPPCFSGHDALVKARNAHLAAAAEQAEIETQLQANGRRMLEIEATYPHLAASELLIKPEALAAS